MATSARQYTRLREGFSVMRQRLAALTSLLL